MVPRRLHFWHLKQCELTFFLNFLRPNFFKCHVGKAAKNYVLKISVPSLRDISVALRCRTDQLYGIIEWGGM